ncbi:MAG: ABC transporter ATP-binding protein [Actinopolymorphaceae bacterium]
MSRVENRGGKGHGDDGHGGEGHRGAVRGGAVRTAFRALWLVVSTAIRVSPRQTVLCLCETAGVTLRMLQPLFLAWLITGVVDKDLGRMAVAAGAYVGAEGVRLVLNSLGFHARIGQLERVGYAFGCQIADVTARIPTLDHLESPAYMDQIQTVRDQEWSLGLAVNMLLNSLNSLVVVGGTIAVAATADWRLLLVALAGIPTVAAAHWFVRWQAAAEDAAAQPGRLAGHLMDLGLAADPGAELRVFGLVGGMRVRLRSTVAAWRGPFVTLARRRTFVDVAGNALFFGVTIAVLAWMVRDLMAGTVPLQAFVLALLLVGRLQSIGSVMQATIGNISQVIRTAGRVVWLLDYDADVRMAHAGRTAPPGSLRSGIRVEGVTYRYPGLAEGTAPEGMAEVEGMATRPRAAALDNLSLDLPAGSVIALVGENGAGKSTLVKVLAGLYRPSAGHVLVDGVDLAALDLTAWRERMSGAFQDYARFEVTAGQCVGFGDLARFDDRARIRMALSAGAAGSVLTALPSGLDTQLGPTWTGGVDLSGGQWQRLALARGMMRDEPLLLVLDEPTSALDAHTEHELFERYAAAARAGRQAGTVTLLVTHRFSTVAAADRIVVLDRGRIAEQGTHDQLIAAGGHYAELYDLQATGYR